MDTTYKSICCKSLVLSREILDRLSSPDSSLVIDFSCTTAPEKKELKTKIK